MTARISKLFVLFTFLLVIVVNGYVYASFSERVKLFQATLTIDKDYFFYIALLAIGVVNFPVLLFSKWLSSSALVVWLNSLATSINLFFCVLLSLLFVLHNGDTYDFSRYELLLKLSIGLIAACVLAYPIYFFNSKSKSGA